MGEEDNPLKGYEGDMEGALRQTMKYNPKGKQQVLKSWLCKLCGFRIMSTKKPSEEGCNKGKHVWIIKD